MSDVTITRRTAETLVRVCDAHLDLKGSNAKMMVGMAQAELEQALAFVQQVDELQTRVDSEPPDDDGPEANRVV